VGGQPPYEIQERALQFSARVIGLLRRFPKDMASRELAQQLLRAASAVGANLAEAGVAESRRDFIHKAGIARKEAAEARYWLQLTRTILAEDQEARELCDEADQLVRILSAMVQNAHKAL
jgi:four helix bundle protein